MNQFISSVQDAAYRSAMILMTQSELLELVEELRELAAAAPTAKVREALTKLADRYATRASRLGCSRDHMGLVLARLKEEGQPTRVCIP
jgi:CRP-like cAMP-binding protein